MRYSFYRAAKELSRMFHKGIIGPKVYADQLLILTCLHEERYGRKG